MPGDGSAADLYNQPRRRHAAPLLLRPADRLGRYIADETGESFNDMGDFRDALDRILARTATPGSHYHPRRWVLDHYDNEHSGKRLLDFVQEHFSDRVHLPKGTELLLI